MTIETVRSQVFQIVKELDLRLQCVNTDKGCSSISCIRYNIMCCWCPRCYPTLSSNKHYSIMSHNKYYLAFSWSFAEIFPPLRPPPLLSLLPDVVDFCELWPPGGMFLEGGACGALDEWGGGADPAEPPLLDDIGGPPGIWKKQILTVKMLPLYNAHLRAECTALLLYTSIVIFMVLLQMPTKWTKLVVTMCTECQMLT